MTQTPRYRCHLNQADKQEVARYTINFYRRDGATDWYDEIRYDSHEIRKEKDAQAPHFHMKLRSAFKGDDNLAVEEIQSIIDNQVNQIEGVLEN